MKWSSLPDKLFGKSVEGSVEELLRQGSLGLPSVPIAGGLQEQYVLTLSDGRKIEWEPPSCFRMESSDVVHFGRAEAELNARGYRLPTAGEVVQLMMRFEEKSLPAELRTHRNVLAHSLCPCYTQTRVSYDISPNMAGNPLSKFTISNLLIPEELLAQSAHMVSDNVIIGPGRSVHSVEQLKQESPDVCIDLFGFLNPFKVAPVYVAPFRFSLPWLPGMYHAVVGQDFSTAELLLDYHMIGVKDVPP